MDVEADVATASGHTDVAGPAAAAPQSRRGWAVVNLDSPYQSTVLVTRWRWYATWWAASLRIFDGDDLKIMRTR